MTALVFVIALMLGYWHFVAYGLPDGFYVTGDLTIYQAAFIATLATACTFAFITKERHAIIAAVVLIVNCAGSNYAWLSDDKVLNQALLDTACAAFFIFYGRRRWEWSIAAIFGLSALSAAAAQFNLIPGPNERPYNFLAWSYPDITSVLGHMASIMLGLGAGDAGLAVSRNLQRLVMASDYRDRLYRRALRHLPYLGRRKEAG